MLRLLTNPTLVSLCLQVTLVGVATAGAPVILDKSQAVADARSDAGTGLCGSATHFAAGQPLTSKADAVTIADKPTTDAMILGRASRLFDGINFRNGQLNTGGDFSSPMYTDALFPFSMDAAAMPVGTDSNFTFRLRGYFNAPAALVGKTISFGINCDDYCALHIGNTDLMPPGNQLVSGRVIKQVTIQDAGLYPIELVYFQNGSIAYLELARSDSQVEECPNDICQVSLTDATKYPGSFKLLQTAELYSSVVGANTSCLECGAAGVSCAAGNYCGNGLCQTCNTADHCGTSCAACPASAHQCINGVCVACTADAQCTGGMTCDTKSGQCKSATTTPPTTDYSGGCSLGATAAATRGGSVAALFMLCALASLLWRRRSA